MAGFDLNNFQLNPDGSYSKKTTTPQPRDIKNPLKTTDLPKYPMHKLTGTVNCNFIDAPVKGWFMVDPSLKEK